MRVRRWLTALLFAPLLVALWLGFAWPPPSWWRTHEPAETAFMAMRDAQYRAAGDTIPRAYRPVPLDSMSRWLSPAATVAEDDAFFQHGGVDWHALRDVIGYRRATFAWGDRRDRAELWRAIGDARGRAGLRGGSTITQQLAKNLYLSPSRNPLRKAREAVLAYRLEWALEKPRILELYLNVAEFGPNTWGVEAASRRYFNRGAARLSLEQAALLAATLPHPLSSNPGHRPGRTRYRAGLILRRLRGEAVVVPKEPEDVAPAVQAPAQDSAKDSVIPDTVPKDSVPVDTLPPDTSGQSTRRSGMTSAV